MLMGQEKQPFSSFANEPNGGESEASEEGGREKGRMRRRGGQDSTICRTERGHARQCSPRERWVKCATIPLRHELVWHIQYVLYSMDVQCRTVDDDGDNEEMWELL